MQKDSGVAPIEVQIQDTTRVVTLEELAEGKKINSDESSKSDHKSNSDNGKKSGSKSPSVKEVSIQSPIKFN